MSIKVLFFSFFKVVFIAIILTLVLTYYFGFPIAIAVTGFALVISPVVRQMIIYFQFRKMKNRPKILPLKDDIPKVLKDYDEQLTLLGFRYLNSFEMLIGLKRQRFFVYIYPTKNIVAYTLIHEGERLRFSSYFADGFTLSTDYPYGIPSETEKSVSHVVKSSLETSFDYHQHHMEQQILLHGETKKFQKLQEIFDWEEKNNSGSDELKQTMNRNKNMLLKAFMVIFLISPIFTALMTVIFYFISRYLGYQEFPLPYRLAAIFISIVIMLFGIFWAFKPILKPETVEDRKKKELA